MRITDKVTVKSSGDDLSLIDGTYNDDNDGDQNDDDRNDGNGKSDTDDNNSNDDDEEEGNTQITESDFRFEDFEKRLVNPRVVRACTMVLADWEKITTRALKSAVTILHRIAFGCKVPAMLFQASLFRIFQQVFGTIRDAHHEELRRLGIYIIRKFVEIAPSNPKIFAELLFYKSLRESVEVEMGYDGSSTDVRNKKAWNEEQEDELRQLFMENQNNPATDMDVIDWIMDNLIDGKNRTRRGVIKKLKDLGLIFKAPTKKSTAAAVAKHAWLHDQDQQLRNLYDEFRLEKDCLKLIMNVLGEKRTKNATINRMISLGLIADRSEIVRQRKKKTNPTEQNNDSDSGEDDDDQSDANDDDQLNEQSNRLPVKLPKKKVNTLNRKLLNVSRRPIIKKPEPKKKTIKKAPIDIELVKTLMNEMNESLREMLAWIEESLNDAAEDIEDEPSDDPDDGIPIVPINTEQRDALDNVNFRFFLISLGIQPPSEEMETYWKIPVNFTAEDLKLRSRILSGEDVAPPPSDEDNNSDCEIIEQAEESDADEMPNLQGNLIYNPSDDEDSTRSTPLKRSTSPRPQKPKKKFDIFDMVKINLDNNEYDEASTSKLPVNGKLSQLLDSDDSDNDNKMATTTIRKRIAIIDSDSDEELPQPNNVSNSEVTTTFESHPVEMKNGSNSIDETLPHHSSQPKGSIHRVSEEENATANGTQRQANNNKRDRSESDESMPDDETPLKPHKKAKNARRAIIDDDDDE